MKSTNYQSTLILPAEDCRATEATVPAKAGSIAALQYEMMNAHDYAHTSDDVLVTVEAQRKGISTADLPAFRASYFSVGRPCFRASPLTKTHGWAIHSDQAGHVALIDPASARCVALQEDADTTVLRALRNKRA